MERAYILFLIILALVVVLVVGGVFAGPLYLLVRRRIPHFRYDSAEIVLWGLLILFAFVMGLVVMYSLLKF